MRLQAALIIIAAFVLVPVHLLHAQVNPGPQVFSKIELFEPIGDSTRETDVQVRFDADTLIIANAKNGNVIKRWTFAEIKTADYSYTKNPRWKTGLGLGAAGFLFPPLWLVAIPLGFTKHRRHWLTIRTESDFAVLKLSKSNRKFVIPTLETRAAIKVAAVGDDK
jgi:hypothetical protein